MKIKIIVIFFLFFISVFDITVAIHLFQRYKYKDKLKIR